MDNLKKYTEIIEQALAKIEMGRQPARLYDPLYYALDTGGKRIRPRLVLLLAQAFGFEGTPLRLKTRHRKH